MHQSTPYFYLVLILTFFLSCSDRLSDLKTEDVSIQVDEETLRVRNQFNHSIYYFAVESGVAAQIKWAPISTPGNQIKPNRDKVIQLNEIHAFDPGETILFYYWSEKEPDNENIKFQRIETLLSEDE